MPNRLPEHCGAGGQRVRDRVGRDAVEIEMDEEERVREKSDHWCAYLVNGTWVWEYLKDCEGAPANCEHFFPTMLAARTFADTANLTRAEENDRQRRLA